LEIITVNSSKFDPKLGKKFQNFEITTLKELEEKNYCKFEKKLTKNWIFFAKLLKHTLFFSIGLTKFNKFSERFAKFLISQKEKQWSLRSHLK